VNNLTLIAIGIIVFWIIAIAFYFYVSREQEEIAADIEELREILDGNEHDVNLNS
jgi:hypothetical protein